MLGRLDSQMDRADYSALTSASARSLPSQLTGEPAPSTATALPAAPTTHSALAPAPPSLPPLSPPTPTPTPPTARVALSRVVSSLVESWSLAFLDLARSGDGPSMLLVAQMYLVERGYGAIRFDRSEGVSWLLRCVELDEGEARDMCRRLCPAEYKAWMEDRRRRAGGDEQLRREQEAAADRQRADCAPSERALLANRAATATT